MKKKKQLTDFEWQVLQASLMIPLGETRSYQWIANKIGGGSSEVQKNILARRKLGLPKNF